jgi:hypothetical protein
MDPIRRAVRRRWQFAQTTSHFSISARMLSPVAVRERRADVELLAAQVVELEDHRVALTAVGAWMCAEVLEQMRSAFSHQPLFVHAGLIDVALAVREIVLPSVGLAAGPAERVPLSNVLAAPGELLRRLGLAAPVALPGFFKIV